MSNVYWCPECALPVFPRRTLTACEERTHIPIDLLAERDRLMRETFELEALLDEETRAYWHRRKARQEVRSE